MTSQLEAVICLLIVFLCCNDVSILAKGISSGTTDGSEEWGYVNVRQGAHVFWWLYKTPNQTTTNWPVLLWLQGGPGASSTGYGNFEEIGPLTATLLPRQYTWLRKAHLLFVDSPVGAGFSFVENESLLLTKDDDVTTDMLSLLQTFFEDHEQLQSNPLFLFAESYGGKYVTLLGLALNQAIKKGDVKARLGGVALGDSWISPIDSMLSWGPVLRSFSRIDGHQEEIINGKVKVVQADVEKGAYWNAKAGWSDLEAIVLNLTNNVDFFNILRDKHQGADLPTLMNGPIRKKLQIIPKAVIWGGMAKAAFIALGGDFMKDVVSKVDELLLSGVNVTIYSGQLDLICANQGTEAWVKKLTWPGMSSFLGATRMPLYCNNGAGLGGTDAFVRTYKNLVFYWILRSGHMVPIDNPCFALDMVGLITSRP